LKTDSRCIDLESLCILVEEQAWEVRVDIHVLNHEGNLIDAATLAALGALCHFKRPDVTLDGRDVIIHQLDERDPVPLTILHHPLTLSFALFNQG
jgi:exosome complex component RRP45